MSRGAQRQEGKLRVALKYCGGCDPAYERVDYFNAIKKAAGESIEWVSSTDPGSQAMLLICGCHKACPLEEMPYTGRMVVLKHDSAAPEEVAARLKQKGEPHDHQDQG